MGQQGLRAHKVFKVILGQQVLPALRAILVPLDHKASRAFKVFKA